MVHPKLSKIIALVMAVLIVTVSVNDVFSVAHEIEEAGFTFPHAIKIGLFNAETYGHCPACPTDDHPTTDHAHNACDHHNQTSLTDQTCDLTPTHFVTPFALIEPFKAVPEIYLDKFIPPQNPA